MTTKMSRQATRWLTVACTLLTVAVGCKKKEPKEASTTASTAPSATPAETAPAGGAGAAPRAELGVGDEKLPVVVAPAGSPDPYEGKKFTLDEATAGLAGSGKLAAEIQTRLGTINCELLPEAAPETVASFVGLARGKRPWKASSGEWKRSIYFEGLLFHRVIPGFMIQGGDPEGSGRGGPGYTLPDEIVPSLTFAKPGVLAMANKGAGTHSGGSQFFITDGTPTQLNGGYVVFGQCDAPDVVKAIAGVQRNEMDRPLEPVSMQVRIFRR